MSEEKLTEYQYSRSLGDLVTLFATGFAGATQSPGAYPGEDWMFSHYGCTDAMDLIIEQKKIEPALISMDLFNRIAGEVQKRPQFQGRTSHILLGLLNRTYIDIEDDPTLETGLTKEVWSEKDGQHINPTFNHEQSITDLPVNLQIRKAIGEAVLADMSFHNEIGEEDGDTASQRAQWYKTLSEEMSKEVAIQPAVEILGK